MTEPNSEPATENEKHIAVANEPVSIGEPVNGVPVWRRFWDENPEPEAIRDWTKGLTPGLIGAALWLPWLDGLAAGSLPFGGVRFSFFGAMFGSVAVLPVFLVLAFLVRSQNKPLRRVLADFTGRFIDPAPGRWLVLITHGALALLVLAVAIDKGAGWYFQTLQFTGYLADEPSAFIRYLTTATWALWVIPIGYGMVRIIAALLDYVPVLIAILLSTLFLMAIGQLQQGEESLIFPVETIADPARAFWHAFWWTFTFGLVIAVFAADWGMGLHRASDIMIGGVVGLTGGLMVAAAMGLLIIAAFGQPNQPVPGIFAALTHTGKWGVLVGGLLVGTYAAAPGVFASYHLLQDLRQVFPRVHHWTWLMLKIVLVQVVIWVMHSN
ncbi:MAG: hypothetical protein ACKO5E_17655 [bacterium]